MDACCWFEYYEFLYFEEPCKQRGVIFENKPWSSEAQQRYFSYRAIPVATLSQNSFGPVLKGYRTIVERYVAKWDIAQMCCMKQTTQGGFAPFWGTAITSLKKASRDMGYRTDSIARSRDMGPWSARWSKQPLSALRWNLRQVLNRSKQTGGDDICVATGITIRCSRYAKRRHCTGKRLSRAIWSSFNKEGMLHLCDSTVAGPTARKDNVLASKSNANTPFPLPHRPSL